MKFNQLRAHISLCESIRNIYGITLSEAIEVSNTLFKEVFTQPEINLQEFRDLDTSNLESDNHIKFEQDEQLKAKMPNKEILKIDLTTNSDKHLSVTFKDDQQRIKTEPWKMGKALISIFPELAENPVMRQKVEAKIKHVFENFQMGSTDQTGIPKNYKFRIFTYERDKYVVEKWYEQLHAEGVKSCVSDKSEGLKADFYKFFQLTEANMLILFNDDEPVGRAILWNNVADKPYMDRVYPQDNDKIISIYHQYAKNMGWYYRMDNSYGGYNSIGPTKPPSDIGFTIDRDELEGIGFGSDLNIPYIDTFRMAMIEHDIVFFTNSSDMRVRPDAERILVCDMPLGRTISDTDDEESPYEDDDNNEVDMLEEANDRILTVREDIEWLNPSNSEDNDPQYAADVNNIENFDITIASLPFQIVEMYNCWWYSGIFGNHPSSSLFSHNNKNVFNGGTWEDGTWLNGKFVGSAWRGGTWEDGEFLDSSRWFDGTWKNGKFKRSKWYKGTWEDGEFLTSTWLDGIWNGGTFYSDSDWKDGTWNGGIWKGGTWENGIWETGWWKGGLWLDGTWNGGTWQMGIWRGGKWKDGIWNGGIWEGGWIFDPSNKYNSKKDSEGFCWSEVDPSVYFRK